MAMFWLCGGVFSRAEGSVGEFLNFGTFQLGVNWSAVSPGLL